MTHFHASVTLGCRRRSHAPSRVAGALVCPGVTVSARSITVSSRALGPRLKVRVIVYDTQADMIRAGERYNGTDLTGSIGVTQARVDDRGRAVGVIVRLWRDRLGTVVVSHEMHHATTALYAATLPDRIQTRSVMHHHNEPFAYLYSDLLGRLVQRLHALGYYAEG